MFVSTVTDQSRKFVFGCVETYRYGFNGKEKDDEVSGAGNQYDYGFRIYNPRLGKFLSVDPIAEDFPWNSTYAFAENDVIRSIDLEGLEKYIVHQETNGSVSVNYNPNDPNGENGLVQYEKNGPILDKFKRPEEEDAANRLDKYRENPKSTVVGVTVLYAKETIKKEDDNTIKKKTKDEIPEGKSKKKTEEKMTNENKKTENVPPDKFKKEVDVTFENSGINIEKGASELINALKEAKKEYDKNPSNFELEITLGVDVEPGSIMTNKFSTGKLKGRTLEEGIKQRQNVVKVLAKNQGIPESVIKFKDTTTSLKITIQQKK